MTRQPKPNRLLPSKGGSAVFSMAVEQSQIGDYFVIALSMDDLPPGRTEPIFAEYTHCLNKQQAQRAMLRYSNMREVFCSFVLEHVPNLGNEPWIRKPRQKRTPDRNSAVLK